MTETLIKLHPPVASLTPTEEQLLARVFTDNPIIGKYLHMILWGLITDNANIPLPVLAADLQENALKQAFVKGGISTIHMLLTITEPPTTVQPPAQSSQQAR